MHLRTLYFEAISTEKNNKLVSPRGVLYQLIVDVHISSLWGRRGRYWYERIQVKFFDMKPHYRIVLTQLSADIKQGYVSFQAPEIRNF